MTSREQVRRAIEFSYPARIPAVVSWVGNGALWETLRDSGTPAQQQEVDHLLSQIPKDLLVVKCQSFGWEFDRAGVAEGEWPDEWGTLWRGWKGTIRAIGHPLEEWSAFNNYTPPDPDIPGRMEEARQAIASNRDEKYLLGVVFLTLWERYWLLRGFEDALLDHLLYPDRFLALRDVIVEHNLALTRKMLALGVDGIYFSDDWGSQQALLISPQHWREWYRPGYEELFGEVRRAGAHVWLHSDGNVMEIVPDLMECGLNVLNPLQPMCMPVEEFVRRFGGRLCVYGGADVQGVLSQGSPQEVEEEVCSIVRKLSQFGGGLIATHTHTIMPETPIENVLAMLRIFLKYCVNQPG